MFVLIDCNIGEAVQTAKAFLFNDVWIPKSCIVKTTNDSVILDSWVVKGKNIAHKQVSFYDIVDKKTLVPLKELINKNHIDYFPKELMKHQQDAFNFCKGLKACALFMDMGTGKSKLYIDLAEYHYLAKNIKNVMFFAPPTTLDNFKNELKLWQSTNLKFDLYSIHFLSKKIGKGLNQLLDLVDKDTMIIIDESHRIKNVDSLMSSVAHLLGQKTEYKIIGTGTSSPNNAMDLVGQGRFLAPKSFPQSKNSLNKMFKIADKGVKKDVKNKLETLCKVLPYAYTLTKEEALELPPLVKKEVFIDDKDLINFYKENINGAKILFFTSSGTVMGFLQNLRKLSSGINLDGEVVVENPKIKALQEILLDIPQDKKIIIWHNFYHEIASIVGVLDGNAVILNGSNTDAEKSRAINEFKTNNDVRFLVATSAVGGVGLNFTEAEVNIFYNNSFNLIDKLQSSARSHRIGQTKQVIIYDLVNKGTVEERIYSSLNNKVDFMQEVMEIMKKQGKDAVIKEVLNG